jgi:predicted metal-dependent hydrolase
MKKWQNKEDFKARVREWAKKIDVDVRVISIRAMKNKWASFTAASRLLIFNAELLTMDKKLGDYVIVHELLHFSVPNHGRLWKSLMQAHLGDYELLEEKLNRTTIEILDI